MKRACLAYAILGLALWPVPLLNVLQVESAAVVAFTAFFVAGWAALRSFGESGESLRAVLVRQEGALLVPLVFLLTAQLWAPNCTLGQGLLFYLLFPGITVVLAVSLAFLLTALPLEHPFAILAGIGFLVAGMGPIYDLGFHPQLYTYNHVFGGVLGPLYDEQLAVRTGLFVFRGLTLLWAGACVLAGRRLRGRGSWSRVAGCLLAIGMVYAFAAPLGINTSPSTLRTALGGHHQTAHFDLYYDPSSLDSAAVAALADDHEAHYASIRRRLETSEASGSGRIQSYLYPNPDVKARLTGARRTSVAPVWLSTPQVHMLERRAASSLGHELAHVLARPYGLPFLRASWAPGLVEGWAVALEPPDPAPSPHDLVSVGWAADSVEVLTRKADALADRLSPWGFWTGRGAVSYATMGSFVDYLLHAYGPERLKQVYAWANFEQVYGRSLQSLAREWAAYVRARPVVSAAAHEVVSRRFTQPSLFEVECPHYVPPPRRHLQAARRAQRHQDTAQVHHHLQRALSAAPRYEAAHAALAQLRLAQGRARAVRQQLDTLRGSSSPGLSRLRGDAYALTGRPDSARTLYAEARAQTPRYAHERRSRLMLRDAVAHRPAVIRTLVSGDSAHVQARRLTNHGDTPAVFAWRAVRHSDAHQYEPAAALWNRVGAPLRGDRPRAWHQAWAVQERAWHAEAAVRAGQLEAAQRIAQEGARRADSLGATAWAETLRYWTTRASGGELDSLGPEPERFHSVSSVRTSQKLLGSWGDARSRRPCSLIFEPST